MDLSKLRHGFFKVITFSRFLHGFVKVATHGFIKVLVLVLVSILDYSNGVKGNCFMPPRKYFSLWKKKIFAKLYWEIWENPIAELLGNIFAQLAIFVIPLLKRSLHPLKDTKKYWKYWKITIDNICNFALKCSSHPLNLCFSWNAICLATLLANDVKYYYFALLLRYLKKLFSFQLQHKGCVAWVTVLNWRKAFCTKYFAKVNIL